ncbi:MAG: HAMP domain-containing methyl-accepting chemotaxis protein [Ancalomicrobiaceae bacterium]|nr:HAMP domain-containing methyl-accepting chemotaxis protein [Ancalomicrobiaceae bacterium]
MSFKNWPMLWKVLSLLILLACAGLIGITYTARQITVVDALDSAIIDGPAAATTFMSRANRYALVTELSIYKNILADNEADDAMATQARADAVRLYHDQAALAKKASPQFAAEINAIEQRFDNAVAGACGNAVKLAIGDNSKEGMSKANAEMSKACAPELDDLIKTSSAMNSKFIAEKDRQNAEATAVAVWSERSSLTGFILATAAVLAIAFFAVRIGVVAPLRSSMTVMAALGRGELSNAVPGTDRGDEIGAMSKTLETLRGQLQEAERMRQVQAEREEVERQLLARRERLANDFVGHMQQLAGSFAQSSGEVADAAKNLSATAEETSRQAQAVAAAAEEAATNVQTVAASSEEMAASVREITNQVGHSAKVADTAFIEAEASNTRIGALASAASAIGDVINLIKGIADQTNLLALNATIEAARAGEAGRGFAVVAAEVKQLADQTAKATGEIGTKVGEIQQATEGSVKSMTEIVRIIANIKEIASAIASAVEQQGAATAEIARNCQQAATGTHQVTENISGVGQAAEMTGAASTQLMTLSNGLSGQAGNLRTTVEAFVKEFAAA